jgi:hypothetical protein
MKEKVVEKTTRRNRSQDVAKDRQLLLQLEKETEIKGYNSLKFIPFPVKACFRTCYIVFHPFVRCIRLMIVKILTHRPTCIALKIGFTLLLTQIIYISLLIILIHLMQYKITLYNHIAKPIKLSSYLDLQVDVIHPQYLEYHRNSSDEEKLNRLNFISSDVISGGRNTMKQYHLFICLIVRDTWWPLLDVINYIERTGQLFQNYTAIIIENDSTDKTPDVLQAWYESNPSRVHVIRKTYNITKRPSIQFLANLRNIYLDEIWNHYHNFTNQSVENSMMMVVDSDMKYGWDMRGVYHSFYHINEWEAVCSNGIFTPSGRMYDAFAFRNHRFPYNNTEPNYWPDIARQVQMIHPPEQGLQTVYSCFGGMAFYKLSYVKDCNYTSVRGDCEHVAFHHCINTKNHGRITMNNALILRYTHYGIQKCCQCDPC